MLSFLLLGLEDSLHLPVIACATMICYLVITLARNCLWCHVLLLGLTDLFHLPEIVYAAMFCVLVTTNY